MTDHIFAPFRLCMADAMPRNLKPDIPKRPTKVGAPKCQLLKRGGTEGHSNGYCPRGPHLKIFCKRLLRRDADPQSSRNEMTIRPTPRAPDGSSECCREPASNYLLLSA
jgi:hypothetical protein